MAAYEHIYIHTQTYIFSTKTAINANNNIIKTVKTEIKSNEKQQTGSTSL